MMISWVCCSVLQYVAVCCGVLQYVAGCHSAFYSRYVPREDDGLSGAGCCSVLQCVAVCCSVLQCVAVCCSVLQCAACCCGVLCCRCVPWVIFCRGETMALKNGVLQCVAVCCSVLQCVAVCCSVLRGFVVCCSVLQHKTSETLQDTARHCKTIARLASVMTHTRTHLRAVERLWYKYKLSM